jgi:hypothetical protein
LIVAAAFTGPVACMAALTRRLASDRGANVGSPGMLLFTVVPIAVSVESVSRQAPRLSTPFTRTRHQMPTVSLGARVRLMPPIRGAIIDTEPTAEPLKSRRQEGSVRLPAGTLPAVGGMLVVAPGAYKPDVVKKLSRTDPVQTREGLKQAEGVKRR